VKSEISLVSYRQGLELIFCAASHNFFYQMPAPTLVLTGNFGHDGGNSSMISYP
jgi:hypothetical protein